MGLLFGVGIINIVVTGLKAIFLGKKYINTLTLLWKQVKTKKRKTSTCNRECDGGGEEVVVDDME